MSSVFLLGDLCFILCSVACCLLTDYLNQGLVTLEVAFLYCSKAVSHFLRIPVCFQAAQNKEPVKILFGDINSTLFKI